MKLYKDVKNSSTFKNSINERKSETRKTKISSNWYNPIKVDNANTESEVHGGGILFMERKNTKYTYEMKIRACQDYLS